MNRQSRYISVVLICILLSCKTVISIEGVVQNLPGDKIYLQKKEIIFQCLILLLFKMGYLNLK